MTKEELIAFINSIDFELATNLVLTYIKKKPSRYDNDDFDSRPKTITLNKDYEILINERINYAERRIDDCCADIRHIEETINEKR